MATHDAETLASLYSVREVSAMLALTPRQIRAFVADGAAVPVKGDRGRFLFSFQDLVVLRAAADLIGQGVAPQRVHAAIRGLRDQLPTRTSLAGATLDASGRTVVVRLDAEVWEPESGQTVFDFDVAGIAERAEGVRDARALGRPETGSAEAWYVFADEVEQDDPAAAEAAYRTAIELDPCLADARLNLGRLLHSAGAVREALDEYRVAHEIDHEDATTLYNIGVASQDLGKITEAMTAYERALALAPRFADARFNLASLYEEQGEIALATQHLRAYKDLVEGG
jgi:tetratricopeptide (TPR) repeat protein